MRVLCIVQGFFKPGDAVLEINGVDVSFCPKADLLVVLKQQMAKGTKITFDVDREGRHVPGVVLRPFVAQSYHHPFGGMYMLVSSLPGKWPLV